MTTFKEIRGNLIKSTSTDPANPQDGQIWYNSTSQVLKGEALLAAWSSGGSLSTARSGLGSFGIQTAAVGVAGETGIGAYTNITEEYNGSGWTAGGTSSTTRGALIAGAGTQTAGMITGGFNGSNLNNTEEYNGSSWTAGGSLTRTATLFRTQ